MFHDRNEAGRLLSEKLKKYQTDAPVILALPRGGVPIGFQIATSLHAPLDLFVVRKIGVPGNPEFGVGAVAPDVLFLDEATLHALGLTHADLRETIAREQQELKRRLHVYRGTEDPPAVAGKTVILVDDGVATGVTTRAAILGIRRLKPKRLILAVPVAPLDDVESLKKAVDEFVCLETPAYFYAVGAFYHNFPQVSDEEVIALLKAKSNRP